MKATLEEIPLEEISLLFHAESNWKKYPILIIALCAD